MSETVFHNALIVPVDGVHDWFEGWLSVDENGIITGIGQGTTLPEAAGYRDLGGALVGPGFVSAHSHIFTGGMRGTAASSPLYDWVSTLGRMMVGAEPETLYWLTLSGALDHISNGITSVYNFAQSRVVSVFDYESSTLRAERVHSPEFITRQIDGMADAGIRFVTSVRLDDEQLPEADAFDAFGVAMAHLDTVDPRFTLGGSVYGAVQWSSAAVTAEREHEMMIRHGVTNQAHFVETAEQLDIQQNKFDWYDTSGCLGTDFAFGHFVHPTPRMVERVVETGSSVVWQPMSNGRLGSGICDTPTLLRRGVRVGMGVDDQSCTDLSDPFQNMRTGLYLQRAVHSDASILSPLDMLTLHTLGSARAIGVDDRVGSLEVGKYADFLVVDPTRPHLGPLWDPVATYVLACGLRNLAEVVIGGKTAWSRDTEQPLRENADKEATARMIAAGAVSGFTPAG